MDRHPKLRFRILLGPSVAIGPGKADLLAAVAQTGSISAAGRSMGMSYKKAWRLIDSMNRCFKAPLVEATTGGPRGGGARLTAMGEEVLACYRKLETRAAGLFAAELEGLGALAADPPPEG